MTITEREFSRIRKQIETECEEKLEALHVLAGKPYSRRRFLAPEQKHSDKKNFGNEPSLLTETSVSPSDQSRPISLTKKIKNIVNSTPKNFTVADIFELLSSTCPEEQGRKHIKSIIANYLNRLVSAGILEVTPESAGKRPKIFRNIQK